MIEYRRVLWNPNDEGKLEQNRLYNARIEPQLTDEEPYDVILEFVARTPQETEESPDS